MKLDFNFNLRGLDGQEFKENAGQLLSTVLANLNKGNSTKLFDWALKLYNKQPLEIDDTDADVLKELIESTEHLTILSKAQMIKVIEKK